MLYLLNFMVKTRNLDKIRLIVDKITLRGMEYSSFCIQHCIGPTDSSNEARITPNLDIPIESRPFLITDGTDNSNIFINRRTVMPEQD
jgi:hypothetical protein